MSNVHPTGIVYTEYRRLSGRTPFASLWSYHSEAPATSRPAILEAKDGRQEFWLERSDPLLNTILPGTLISVVVNLGDAWASGPTLVARVGPCVQAVGAVFPAALAVPILGCTAGALVDKIVRLDDVWPRQRVAEFVERISSLDGALRVVALRDARLGARTHQPIPTTFFRPRDEDVHAESRLRLHGRPHEWRHTRPQFVRARVNIHTSGVTEAQT